MRTLGLIRRAIPPPGHDLLPRLRARLAHDDRVALRLPVIGWLEIAAVAVTLATLVVVPDPLRLLVAGGIL